MKNLSLFVCLMVAVVCLAVAGCQKRAAVILEAQVYEKNYSRPLPEGELALRKITDPAQIPDYTKAFSDLDGLLTAIDRSLNYLAKPSSRNFYPYGDITHDHAVLTLQEIRKLVVSGLSPSQLNEAIRKHFDTYISVGCDDQGTVLYTGYYTPIFDGSPTRTDRFRHPLHKTPADLIKGPEGTILGQKQPDGSIRKYPDRTQIHQSGMLAGLELVWLADPFEVYIVHVQGSAKIRMPDGRIRTFGYDAHNGWDYESIVHKMIADGKLADKNISLKAMMDYFRTNPDEVDRYVNQNPRFVFFKHEPGEPRGSLNEPVTAFRSIATDKSVYPRAMFAYAEVNLKRPVGFLLDQDTGGAIRAAGRCDVYMGVGEEAGKLAGVTYREGRLYYIFLKTDVRREPESQNDTFAPAR